jgi:hypothetical protein
MISRQPSQRVATLSWITVRIWMPMISIAADGSSASRRMKPRAATAICCQVAPVPSFGLVVLRFIGHCAAVPRSEWKPQRQASRASVIAALVESGLDSRQASSWCNLWEAEASRQGFGTDGEHYWAAAKGWIDAHRGSTRPLR